MDFEISNGPGWKKWQIAVAVVVVVLLLATAVMGSIIGGDYLTERAKAKEVAERRTAQVNHWKKLHAQMLGTEDIGAPEGCKLVRRAQEGMRIAQLLQRKRSMEPHVSLGIAIFSIAFANAINDPGRDVTPRITFADLGTTEPTFDENRRQLAIEAGRELLTYIMKPGSGPDCAGTMYDFRDPFVAANRLSNVLESVEADASAIGTTKARIRARLLQVARSEMPALKVALWSDDAHEVVEAKERIKLFMMHGFTARELRLDRRHMERYIAHGFYKNPLAKL